MKKSSSLNDISNNNYNFSNNKSKNSSNNLNNNNNKHNNNSNKINLRQFIFSKYSTSSTNRTGN
jgi:hypothetical protein